MMTPTEIYDAMRESEECATSIEYFEPRLDIDTAQNRRLFKAGFERAYDLRSKVIAKLESELAAANKLIADSREQKPVAWLIPGEDGTEDKERKGM